MSQDRLQRSPEAELKANEISQTSVFIYVEGKSDRLFYEKIARAALPEKILFEIKPVSVSTGGGKGKLLELFALAASKGKLCSDDGIKRTLLFFFLDADLDRIAGHDVVSDHVAYTRHYTAENYYFLHGDLVLSIAHAISVDRGAVGRHFKKSNRNWALDVSTHWRPWVTCCCFSSLQNINVPGYKARSQIHVDPDGTGAFDSSKEHAHLRKLSKNFPGGQGAFDKGWAANKKLVDSLYDAGKQDEVFNGKWYRLFLAKEACRIADATDGTKSGVELILLSQLISSIIVDEKSFPELVRPLKTAATACLGI